MAPFYPAEEDLPEPVTAGASGTRHHHRHGPGRDGGHEEHCGAQERVSVLCLEDLVQENELEKKIDDDGHDADGAVGSRITASLFALSISVSPVDLTESASTVSKDRPGEEHRY